ncbi:MAG: hypothetical protein J6Q22_11005 [Prevotella sp.]|nr:hypothetical protein [Prevotella sp.]
MEKLEDITKSMRQWVERIGPIPSHEIVTKVFEWARRIEACKNEVTPCTNAATLRDTLNEIDNRITFIESKARFSKCKTIVLMHCKGIKEIIENAFDKPSRNVDRAECDSLDHAAQVFAREKGNELPENPTDAAMIIWMNSLCKWLFSEYEKGDVR